MNWCARRTQRTIYLVLVFAGRREFAACVLEREVVAQGEVGGFKRVVTFKLFGDNTRFSDLSPERPPRGRWSVGSITNVYRCAWIPA